MAFTITKAQRKAVPLPLPSRDDLLAIFHYDPDTGILTWKPRLDSAGRRLTRLDRKCGHITPRGYVKVGVNNRTYSVHRIAWKIMTGAEPPEIDHINGITGDNRFINLRAASHPLNVRNARRHSGKLLPKGVRKHASCSKYEARIRLDGRSHYLGLFPSPESAAEAYKAAAVRMHGQFAKID